MLGIVPPTTQPFTGDASKPKSWSKYATDSTAFIKANVKKRKPGEDEDGSEKKSKPPKKQKKGSEAKELLQKVSYLVMDLVITCI